jgi:RNA recognition motif-containing protein
MTTFNDKNLNLSSNIYFNVESNNNQIEEFNEIQEKKKCIYSLYIGDLTENIKENDIYNLFSNHGCISSLKICYDFLTEKSLGYGYINFENLNDAENVLRKLNFYSDQTIFLQPLRLMWKNQNSTLIKSGVGNLFVKNIPDLFNSKSLFETFSNFGKVISCKVIFDNKGKSMKYGFVHFQNYNDSKHAIKKLNGLFIQTSKIFVDFFVNQHKRSMITDKYLKFTNIYIKNLSKDICNEIYIKKIFEKFGKITSIFIPYYKDTPRGFAFVNFYHYNDAKKAIEVMNNTKIGNSVLYVGKAEKKKDREKILKKIFLDEELGISSKFSQNNILITNLNNYFSEVQLFYFFSQFGKINNSKIINNKKNLLQKLVIINFEHKINLSRLFIEIKPIYKRKLVIIKYYEIFKSFFKKGGLIEFISLKNKNFYNSKKEITNSNYQTNREKTYDFLFNKFNLLSSRNKNLILSEIIYSWVSIINKKLSKKITAIILCLDLKKILLIILSEYNFLKVIQKIIWMPN